MHAATMATNLELVSLDPQQLAQMNMTPEQLLSTVYGLGQFQEMFTYQDVQMLELERDTISTEVKMQKIVLFCIEKIIDCLGQASPDGQAVRDFTAQISKENLFTLQQDVVRRVSELLSNPDAGAPDEQTRR